MGVAAKALSSPGSGERRADGYGTGRLPDVAEYYWLDDQLSDVGEIARVDPDELAQPVPAGWRSDEDLRGAGRDRKP